MWLFTETGFVSAVQHRTEDNTLVVRARDRISLLPLVEAYGVEIKTDKYTDYPYRVFLPKESFAAWVTDSIKFLEYGNFKNQVAITRGKEFAHTLGSVWSTMLDTEDEEARSRYTQADMDWETTYANEGKAKVK